MALRSHRVGFATLTHSLRSGLAVAALAAATLIGGFALGRAPAAASGVPHGLYLEVRNGQRVKPWNSDAVFLVDRGVLRHITYDAYTALFDGWGGIATINEAPATVIGEGLGKGTRLVKSPSRTTVYLIENDRLLRAFDSARCFGANGFSWGKVRKISDAALAEYETGPTIRWRDSRR